MRVLGVALLVVLGGILFFAVRPIESPSPVTDPAAQLVVQTATVALATSTPTVVPTPSLPPPPTAGRWIEVDVTRFTVRLMRGPDVLQTIGPVAVGAQVDTGVYESTQTGLFHVYQKTAGLTFDAPYNTYIDWWVGFDPDKANGFHSFLLDARGAVVDASTGRVSNGCIRTGAAREVFEFAEVGMPVLVHA